MLSDGGAWKATFKANAQGNVQWKTVAEVVRGCISDISDDDFERICDETRGAPSRVFVLKGIRS